MKKLLCATFDSLDATVVEVESTLTKGLPSFSIVGIASTSISESKERVKSALLSNEFKFPPKRITINLSPSDLSKSGSHFDLSIALLIALDAKEIDLQDIFVFGELGLDGAVKENTLLFSLVLSLANKGLISKAIVPFEALAKLSKIPNIALIGVKTLNEAIEVLTTATAFPSLKSSELEFKYLEFNSEKYYYSENYELDFSDVKGQEVAKRAALISACGMHNLLLEGTPGCGKSMIAKRLPFILPPMSLNEILHSSMLESMQSIEPTFSPSRPYKAPHHSATLASVFGGGSKKAQIGEVGLAHNGILFFDEIPHFAKSVLEALREPLEDKKIRVSRVHSKIEYDASFLFIGAMNPCPCGNLLSQELTCHCSELEIKRYKSRLSDPFLDRMDLIIQMQSVRSEDRATLTSKKMHKIVLEVFSITKSRGQSVLNGLLCDSDIEKYCLLDEDAQNILDMAIGKFALSFRSINKIKKVSRTIADINNSKTINKTDVLEALSYRKR
ncbi:MAG: YifB family Mg chelatase-like AAA ATPase [Helicobacteraceae bacterium]|nr:YifB family Mg chelatase-like AAA ATPase [Helicobacteraceae bacterium]